MDDIAANSEKKRILIAEDEEFIANLYKMNLEQHGVQVDIASNGVEAMRALDASAPDLLLLDLLMPEADGFQVMEHVSSNGIDVTAVILTNLSQDIDKEKCHELGAEDFFVKSDLSVEDLWEKIKGYLE